MITRKHIVRIAEIIKGITHQKARVYAIDFFADWIESENPRFDRDRFRKACNDPRFFFPVDLKQESS